MLCASDCEALSVGDLLAFEPQAESAFKETWLGYTEAPGSPGLRVAIAAQYEGISADDVLVFAGAQEAIFAFMQRVLERGSHAVAHFPAYQSLYEVARNQGADVTLWRTREADGWALDPASLDRVLRRDTKAVIINSPHNPTGYLMDRTTQTAIVELARKSGAYLFSDEVYRDSEYDPAARLPAACERYERGVSLGVTSKSLGLAGLRIGWIATRDRDLLERLAEAKDYTTICNAAPSEFLATLALRHRDRILERNRLLIAKNLALLDSFVQRNASRVSWVRPQAAPIGFLRIRDSGGAAAFCHDLLEKAGVLLLPSTIYQMEDTHVRIGFGRANFEQGLAQFEKYLRNEIA
ncbi:MAG: aminotransferase class I/II-fold pyridoxal phosphate-dependent enzyme [Candidatus Baltobacteraceae bacterium]